MEMHKQTETAKKLIFESAREDLSTKVVGKIFILIL